MDIRIIDTTLRDGEQKAGVALGIRDKVEIARRIAAAGVFQIEAGTPAMGGDEKESIEKIAGLNLKCRVSAWNRMNIKDIKDSIDCGVDVVHISVPASDLHIKGKLNKDRTWVINQMKRCIAFAKEKDFIVNVGLEDASRGDVAFLARLCRLAMEEGAQMVRYADTVGILHPSKTFFDLTYLREQVGGIELGIHAHNDFGMALANSIAAVRAGARYVDCTFGGIGERAGNCNYIQFMIALRSGFSSHVSGDLKFLRNAERDIMLIIGNSADRKSVV